MEKTVSAVVSTEMKGRESRGDREHTWPGRTRQCFYLGSSYYVQVSTISGLSLGDDLGQGKTALYLLTSAFCTHYFKQSVAEKRRGRDVTLVTKGKVMNPRLSPVTLCNRRYTWAEEILSTWNLQRMKTTFSKRYKTAISSGHLHLKHSCPESTNSGPKHHGEYRTQSLPPQGSLPTGRHKTHTESPEAGWD